MTLRIFGLALEILSKRRGPVIGAILLPSVLLVAVGTFGPWAIGSRSGAFFYLIVQLAAYSWLAISIHRIVLLNDTFRLRWGWRETRFAGWLIMVSLGIGLSIGLVIFALESIGVPSRGFFAVVFQWLVTIVALYWAAQYFLIFPAIAIDRKYTVTHSSVDTEDYRFTAFMVVAVFPVLLSLVELPASLISNLMLFSLVRSLLSIISITIGVAMLSVLYKELAQNTP